MPENNLNSVGYDQEHTMLSTNPSKIHVSENSDNSLSQIDDSTKAIATALTLLVGYGSYRTYAGNTGKNHDSPAEGNHHSPQTANSKSAAARTVDKQLTESQTFDAMKDRLKTHNPRSFYSQEQIAQYVSEYLNIPSSESTHAGISNPTISAENKNTLLNWSDREKAVERLISYMPDYAQQLLIESRVKLTLYNDIDKMIEGYQKATGVHNENMRGAFDISEQNVHFPDGYDYDIGTFFHEVGHAVDWVGANEPRSFAANQKSLGLSEAIDRHLTRSTSLSPSHHHDMMNITTNRTLKGHLEAGYDKTHFNVETVAELFCEQTLLSIQYPNNAPKVESVLMAKYPEIWPVMRDNYIPQLKQTAETRCAQPHQQMIAETQRYLEELKSNHALPPEYAKFTTEALSKKFIWQLEPLKKEIGNYVWHQRREVIHELDIYKNRNDGGWGQREFERLQNELDATPINEIKQHAADLAPRLQATRQYFEAFGYHGNDDHIGSFSIGSYSEVLNHFKTVPHEQISSELAVVLEGTRHNLIAKSLDSGEKIKPSNFSEDAGVRRALLEAMPLDQLSKFQQELRSTQIDIQYQGEYFRPKSFDTHYQELTGKTVAEAHALLIAPTAADKLSPVPDAQTHNPPQTIEAAIPKVNAVVHPIENEPASLHGKDFPAVIEKVSHPQHSILISSTPMMVPEPKLWQKILGITPESIPVPTPPTHSIEVRSHQSLTEEHSVHTAQPQHTFLISATPMMVPEPKLWQKVLGIIPESVPMLLPGKMPEHANATHSTALANDSHSNTASPASKQYDGAAPHDAEPSFKKMLVNAPPPAKPPGGEHNALPNEPAHPKGGHAMGGAVQGAGLALSLRAFQDIAEREKRGEKVSDLEKAAAATYAADAGLGLIGRDLTTLTESLVPQLGKAGGPLAQTLLAVPTIAAAYKTGDTDRIGAAIGGSGAGIMAGLVTAAIFGAEAQAVIPVPVVGFAIGVIAGEGGAKVGGLVYTALANDDPKKREQAKAELQHIMVEYGVSVGGATNLAGAAVSSIGRTVNLLGGAATLGGDKLDEAGHAMQDYVNKQNAPVWAKKTANALIEYEVVGGGAVLHVAGSVVATVGTVVDKTGQGLEYVGHTANKSVEYLADHARASYAANHKTHNAVVAGTLAFSDATKATAIKAIDHLNRKADETVSWYKENASTWLGGDDTKLVTHATATKPAAHAPHVTLTEKQIQTQVEAKIGEMEKLGWGARIGNGDNHITYAEIRETLKAHGVDVRAFDKGNDGTITGKDISDVLKQLPAVQGTKQEHKGR